MNTSTVGHQDTACYHLVFLCLGKVTVSQNSSLLRRGHFRYDISDCLVGLQWSHLSYKLPGPAEDLLQGIMHDTTSTKHNAVHIHHVLIEDIPARELLSKLLSDLIGWLACLNISERANKKLPLRDLFTCRFYWLSCWLVGTVRKDIGWIL